MPDPTVSVVVPTYDRAPVLSRAVESVLDGGYDAVELHVVDDGSTDRTPSLLDGFDDDRLFVHRLEANRGANVARNRGVAAATGEYVAFLDSDDAYTERYLERCVAALERSADRYVGTYGSRVWYRDGERFNLTVADEDVSHEDLRRKNVVGGFSNVLFRRSVVEGAGGLDEDLASCQDYEFFLRALAPGDRRLRAVPDAVVRYYLHDAGATRIGDDPTASLAGREQFLQVHGDSLTREGLANQYYQFGMTHARDGDLETARRWFRRAVGADPWTWRHWYHSLASLGGRHLFRAAVGLKFAVRRRLYSARVDPPIPDSVDTPDRTGRRRERESGGTDRTE